MTGDLAIETEGLVKVFGETRAVDGIDLPSRRARCTACSARTARARPRPSACWPRCSGPTPARLGCSATTSSPRPTPCAGSVSLTGQFASVDEELSGPREPRAARPPARARARAARRAGRRAARRVRPRPTPADRLVKEYSGGMRRRLDIAAEHRRHARAAVPRRADDRARPAQPQPGVGDRAGARGRGHDGAAHDAVPRRGRPARRPHRHHRPRQGHRRGHQRRAQGARSAPGTLHVRAARSRRSGRTPQRVLADVLGEPVQLESDPAALSVAWRRPRAGRPTRSPSWPRRASPSPSSPSASRASTRCSSP